MKESKRSTTKTEASDYLHDTVKPSLASVAIGITRSIYSGKSIDTPTNSQIE
jgi:hypothetical protein